MKASAYEEELKKGCGKERVQSGSSYKVKKQMHTPIIMCGEFSKEFNKICLCIFCKEKIESVTKCNKMLQAQYEKKIEDKRKEELEFLYKLKKGNWNIPMDKSLLIEEEIDRLEKELAGVKGK